MGMEKISLHDTLCTKERERERGDPFNPYIRFPKEIALAVTEGTAVTVTAVTEVTEMTDASVRLQIP